MNVKKFLFLSLVGLFLPFGVSALNGSVSLSCDKTTLNSGESTTCIFKGNTVDGVSSISAKINLGDGLTLSSLANGSAWQGGLNSGNIELNSENPQSGEFEIASFVVTADSELGVNASISISDIVLSDESIDPVSVSILSDNYNLLSIYLDSQPADLSEPISIEFTRATNVAELYLVPTDATSTISGSYNGTSFGAGSNLLNLNFGINTFDITVTTQDGNTKVYTVNIIRPECRNLSILKINGDDKELFNEIYEYNYVVGNDVTSVDIDAVLSSYIASFVDGFGSRTVDELEVGNNTILVKIKSEYDEELVYTININRLDENGNDVTLEKETVENPKTGVYGASILVVSGCLLTYLVVRKKQYFKKI